MNVPNPRSRIPSLAVTEPSPPNLVVFHPVSDNPSNSLRSWTPGGKAIEHGLDFEISAPDYDCSSSAAAYETDIANVNAVANRIGDNNVFAKASITNSLVFCEQS